MSDYWKIQEDSDGGGRSSRTSRDARELTIPRIVIAGEGEPRKQRRSFESAPPRVSGTIVVGEGTEKYETDYKIGFFSIFFIIISVIISVWMMVKYSQQDVTDVEIVKFIFQNLAAFFMIGVGLTLHVLFVDRTLNIGRLDRDGLIALIAGGIAFAISVVVQGLIQVFFKLAVTPLDLYLIFISLAIAEEMCFRFGLQATFQALVEKYISSSNKYVGPIIAVPLAATIFTLLHSYVYTALADRLAVFGIGLVFGFSFAIMKNTDTNILAHLLTNVIAGILYINTVFGGFGF